MKYENIAHYKYRLPELMIVDTGILGYDISHDLFTLDPSGELIIFAGYLWDGVSGPTWDSDNTMLGGLVHDSGYQMIRLRLLPLSEKARIDKLFYELLRQKRMSKIRSGYYYKAVQLFGHFSCVPGDLRIPRILTA